MQRTLLIIIILMLLIVAIIASLLAIFVQQVAKQMPPNPTPTESRIILSGNVIPELQVARLLGPTDPNQQLLLSVGLKLRNEAELNMMLTAIADPSSPEYHHYITSDQFKQRYSPTSDSVQKVAAFLQSQGFKVTHIAPNNTLIDATGTVAQAEHAFQVQINNYQFKRHMYYANANEPSVPASISQFILSISGLSNAAKGHPEPLLDTT